MRYLFDTDAISELWKRRPSKTYVAWVGTLQRVAQCTSSVVIGELYKGAFRSQNQARLLDIVDSRVLPLFTVFDYDVDVARDYGRLRAQLEQAGDVLAEADLMIAATALRYGLVMVTGNVRHFARIPDLRIESVLADSREE